MKRSLIVVLMSLIILAGLPMSKVMAEDFNTQIDVEGTEAKTGHVDLSAKVLVQYTVEIPQSIDFGEIIKTKDSIEIIKNFNLGISDAQVEHGSKISIQVNSGINTGLLTEKVKGDLVSIPFNINSALDMEFTEAQIKDGNAVLNPLSISIDSSDISHAGNYEGQVDFVVSYGTE